ncbi:MAG: DUF2490 domain-containing protein [Gammaproteobacteria bacterium]|nr:DUF2490 domain-containing protein [Gammaproteobacteria bacterium]
MPIILKNIAFILLIGFSTFASAHISYFKTWTLYTFNGQYDKLLYSVEPQFRMVDQNSGYQQFLFNTGLGTWLDDKWQLWLGQTIVNNNSANNITDDITNTISGEYRLWQQINLVSNNTILGDFLFRTRLEERHPEFANNWSIRFRERMYWTISLTDRQSFVIGDEFFVNVKSAPWITTQTIDQNRVFLGIQQKSTPTLSINLSYLNQFLTTPIQEMNHGIFINLIYMPDGYSFNNG